MIDMFISILKAPLGETASGDVALLDMAAGHFAYLDYTTEAVFSLSFIKNIPQWARQAIEKRTISDGNEQDALYATFRNELDQSTKETELTACDVGNANLL
jgi:hypothetical protein